MLVQDMSMTGIEAQPVKAIADLVHDNVVDSVLFRILVVTEPKAEPLRVKAFKVLHVQVINRIRAKQCCYSCTYCNARGDGDCPPPTQ
jgi:hypothetical protein